MSYPKQIIVVRTDLKMSSGKTAAQVAHSSLGVFTNWMKLFFNDITIDQNVFLREYKFVIANNTAVFDWLENSFTKVALGVDSLEELLEINEKVKDAGLLSCLITDNGQTEFNGVPTITCLAIGPLYDHEFIGLTDHLKPLKDDSATQVRSYEKLLRRIKQTKNVEEIHKAISEYELKKGKTI